MIGKAARQSFDQLDWRFRIVDPIKLLTRLQNK
jgi:hypothetical protein